jgi:hypothetical protein
MTTLELTGLKGHHPLGFLAACGALKGCGGGAGRRRARLAWKQPEDDPGWVAVLHLEEEKDLDSLVEILVAQARQAKDSAALRWSDRISDRNEFRKLGSTLLGDGGFRDLEALALLPALASDLVVNAKTGKLEPTSLDFTSASQPFLKSIRDLSEDLSTKSRRKSDRPLPADSFREALLGPWLYRDTEHSLGWDPQTQRLHALRHKLPEQDKQSRSVRGAIFLASQALPMFPCFVVNRRLRTVGFHRDEGEHWFAWPVWQEPISVDTLRSLLACPLNADLKERGVAVVYRCRVVHTGGSKSNYRVFSNAEELAWEDL